MKTPKLWHLYLFPFVIIFLLLSGERVSTELQKNRSWQAVGLTTNALTETDNRILTTSRVAKVVDGDTIIIDTGEKVRYIGIDTPETKHPTKGVQCYGQKAYLENKAMVEGKDVLLENDISKTDKYGRLLKYVYLPNPENKKELIFINEYLVEQGYARLLTYPPDVKYTAIFIAAEKRAQTEKKGLWNTCTK